MKNTIKKLTHSMFGIFEKTNSIIITVILLLLLGVSCKKNDHIVSEKSEISPSIIAKLKAAGFDTSEGFSKYKNGYLVEYDIFMSEDHINNLDKDAKVKIPLTLSVKNFVLQSKDPISHYVGNTLTPPNSTQRNIQIYMGSSFGTYLQAALDEAISRYNALNFGLVFNRATNASSADIVVSPVYINPSIDPDNAYLMSAGFPSNGNPYNQVLVNTYYFNNTSNRFDATSSLAHEIGHAIGFRHTDYMNRAFSCGAVRPGNNEGGNATLINGTSPDPQSGSWMLACSSGLDRPFTRDDILALKGTYPYKRNIWVKDIVTLISDDSSTIGCCDDHNYSTWNHTLYFYQNESCTIPYTTTDDFVLNRLSYYGATRSFMLMFIPNGVTSYDLGTSITDIYYSYGTEVQNNSNEYLLGEFGGYYSLYDRNWN